VKQVPVQQLARAVNQGVRSYVGKVRWADERELRQEAWLAAVESARTWCPERGELEPYAYRAILIRLGKWVLRTSHPVYAPDGPAGRRALIESRGIELRSGAHHCDTAELADDHMARVQWERRLRAKVLECVGGDAEAFALLLGNRRGRGRLAKRLEESAVSIYIRLREDPELRSIWKDRP
jgi:hypothetical protein